MVQAWPSVEVAIVVPMALARAMFEHAGRFDARGAAVLLWSGADKSELSEPVGCFYVRWHDPAEDRATIRRLDWDPARGGSADEVRRAIAVLGGAPA